VNATAADLRNVDAGASLKQAERGGLDRRCRPRIATKEPGQPGSFASIIVQENFGTQAALTKPNC
jgi:hypothetical protein